MTTKQTAKLTARSMADFTKSAKSGSRLWDTEIKGFHARMRDSKVTFNLFYRSTEGNQRTLTIGKYPALTPDQAKEIARQMMGRIASGEDVQATKKQTKAEEQQKQQQTLGAFIDEVYTPYQEQRKKSGGDTIGMLKKHFVSWLGKPMGEITRKDVQAWQREKEKSGLAFQTIKRVYGALKTCLNYAVKVESIEGHQLEKCQLEKPHLTESELITAGSERRYLDDSEIEGLFAGIEAYQEEKRAQRRNSRAHGKAHLPDFDKVEYVDHVAPFILTMYYTGFRPGDLLGLRWEHVNLTFKTIRKTIEKTAHHQAEPRTFPISSKAVEVLETWHKQEGKPQNGYVFTNPITGKRFDKGAMQKPWAKIREKGGLPENLQMYTLRHNFASKMILSGADLMTVSKLMAHTSIETTIQHYGHLKPDMGRDIVEQFANAMDKPGQARRVK